MNYINFDIAQKNFLKYTEEFDLTNPNIKRKQGHSLRVMQICENIAKKENFSEEEGQIAKIVGLLHDIARFKQYTENKTFRDIDSFDHGDEGVKILENNNFIRKFIQDDKYDSIIKKAVKNHNKFKIEEGLTSKEEKFCKIIRDADKIDIFWEAVELFWKGKESEIENSIISKEIQEQFYKAKTINKKSIKSKDNINQMIIILAFVFDINYKESFKIIEKEQYINKIIDRFDFKNQETKKAIEDMKKFANHYVLKSK